MTHPIYGPQPIGPTTGTPRPASAPAPVAGKSFQEVLEGKLETGLKFSAHALQRLDARNIKLDETRLARLEGAVERASAKGARDSLVLMDDLALVVSVKNRTVITAMDGFSVKDNVFTNIDSAVIV